jgi:iron complex outermembrane recepter protein
MLKSSTASLSALAFGLVAADVYAQVQTTNQSVRSDGNLAEIVVTARRREERTLDIPDNISAVGGADIEAARTADVPELVRSIPGVSVVDRGYRNSGTLNTIFMRGINVDGAAFGDYAVSTVSPVSSYVNDTPMFANFLLRDLNRVEVLRGPQGTLYGSGSLGGTLRYIVNAPELRDFSASVRLGGAQAEGSDGTGWDGDLTLNAPLGDSLALRLVGAVIDYPGIVDLPNAYVLDATGAPAAPGGNIRSPDGVYQRIRDADTVEIGFGRAALRFRPGESVDVTLTYVRQSDDIGGRRQVTVGQDGFGRTYRDYELGSIQREPATRDLELTALEATVDLGFATLNSSSSYYDHQGDSISENTGFYEHAGFWPYYFNMPRPEAVASRTYSDRAFTQELRLVSDSEDGAFDYVLGLYYQKQNLVATQDSFLPGFYRWCQVDAICSFALADIYPDQQDFHYRREEDFKDRAVFGEGTWHATDRVDLTLGFRYFENEDVNDTEQFVTPYRSLRVLNVAMLSDKDSQALFRGNVAFRLAADHLLYATVSEGYRRGGTNAVPTEGGGFFVEDPIWQDYRSDSVTNYELGIKGRTQSGLRYDASVFYIDWQDPQYNTATTIGFFAVKNAESARSTGVELALDGKLAERLHFNVGYSYTKAELTADALTPFDVLIAHDGDELPGIPKHMLTGSLDYAVPMGANSLFFRVAGFYQSATRNSLGLKPPDVAVARFNTELESFSIFNASATWYQGSTWDVTLYMKNILNEAGITGEYTNAYMGNADDPTVTNYYGNGSKVLLSQPRTIGLSATMRF